jgi:predicted dinucleotide-binding enzyme
VGTVAEAAAFGEILVNATLGASSIQTFRLADSHSLDGKIIIDIANPLDFSHGMPPGLIPELSNSTSLGEEMQKAFPGAKIIKTFNTMWCGLMVNPGMVGDGDHINFISGNDNAAKQKSRELMHEMGWRDESIIDLGDIAASRGTEAILPLWLRLMTIKQTAAFNFKIVG